jgi:hypothetical protein
LRRIANTYRPLLSLAWLPACCACLSCGWGKDIWG